MKYVRRLYTLPEAVAERIDKEHNSSATVVDALKLYWESKDAARQVINQSKRIIELLEEPRVPEKTFEQHLQEKLALTRSNHPDWTLRIEGSEVQAYHRGRQVWQNIDEIEEY